MNKLTQTLLSGQSVLHCCQSHVKLSASRYLSIRAISSCAVSQIKFTFDQRCSRRYQVENIPLKSLALRQFHFIGALREKNLEQSSATMSRYVVGHDKQNSHFYIQLRDAKNCTSKQKDLALLEYTYVRPELVDLHHTEVPPEFRGQGIAKILAEAALDHFCEKDVKIRPSCTYIQKYLNDNPLPRYIDHIYRENKSS